MIKKNILLFTYSVLLLINLILYWIKAPSTYNEVYLFVILIIDVFSVGVLFFCKEKQQIFKPQLFRPVFIFLFAYLIVFCQYDWDLLLGFKDTSNRVFANQSVICQSALLASIGLEAFLAGFLLPVKANDNFIEKKKISIVPKIPILMIITLLLIMVTLFVPTQFLLGGYGNGVMESSLYGYVNSWVVVFFMAVLIIHHRNYKVMYIIPTAKQFFKDLGYWFYINLFFYSFIILNVGDRGPLIILVFAMFFSYIFTSNIKIKTIYIVVGLFLSVIIVNFLKETKSYRMVGSGFIERIEATITNKEEIEGASISSYTEELATSKQCLNYPLAYEADKIIHKNGTYQLTYLLSVIPFSKSIFPLKMEYKATSEFVTEITLGKFANWGLGTNIVADLYIDLGIFGVVIFLLFFGYFVRLIETNMFNYIKITTLFFNCLALYYSAHMLYMARSSILFNIKYAIWLFVFLTIYYKLVGVKR